MVEKTHYSFKPGIKQLRIVDVNSCKEELMSIISMRKKAQPATLRRRMNDWENIPLPMFEGINSVFSKYGVSKEDVWKIWTTND